VPGNLLDILHTENFVPWKDDFEIHHLHPMGHVPRNYHENLAEIRDTVGVAPIWFVKNLLPCYAITRYDDVRAAFGDPETFSPELTAQHFTWPVTGEQLMGYEGEKHIEFRKGVMKKFNKSAAQGYIAEIFEPRARELAGVIRDKARESDAPVDLMHEFGHKFPMAIISDLLGLPIEDWDRMAQWAEKIILGGSDPAEQARAAEEFRAYLMPVMEARRAAPREDLLSTVLRTELFGKPLTHEQIVGFMVLMFPAGIDTTWLSIGSMLAAVLSSPGAKERLIDQPELRQKAVEETLRWEPPTPLIPRLTRRDIELSGVCIPANSLTVLALGAANREPGRFGERDPAVWDLDRVCDGHLAFSYGQHMCLGIHIARAELKVALDVMLEVLPAMELVEAPVFAGSAIRGPRSVMVAV